MPVRTRIAMLEGIRANPIVVGAYTSANIKVYANNGSGTFSAGATSSMTPSVSDVTLADLNGDGKLDVVCADNSSASVPASSFLR